MATSSKVIIMLFVMLIFAGGFVYIYKFTRLLKTAGSACEPAESEKVPGTASYVFDASKKCIPSNCLTGYTFTSNTCVVDTASASSSPTPPPSTPTTEDDTSCIPTRTDPFAVTYNKVPETGECISTSCIDGYEPNSNFGICMYQEISPISGEDCTPTEYKDKIINASKYETDKKGNCKILTECKPGFKVSKGKCVANKNDSRLVNSAYCIDQVKISETVTCWQNDNVAGIKWLWPELIDRKCRAQVSYYEIEVYSTNNIKYKWVKKYKDEVGATLSASFYLPPELQSGDLMWSVFAYDKQGKKLSIKNKSTFRMVKNFNTVRCEDVAIRPASGGWEKKLNTK